MALYRYEDALMVTEAEPLVAYLLSMRRGADIPEEKRTVLVERVRAAIAARGALHITKDSSLFEAWLDADGAVPDGGTTAR